MEPDHIAQTAELDLAEDRRQWFIARIDEMRQKGIAFCRLSLLPEASPWVCLVEGWIKQPKDQGEPRFQLTTPEGEQDVHVDL